jgi:hypothetical protein
MLIGALFIAMHGVIDGAHVLAIGVITRRRHSTAQHGDELRSRRLRDDRERLILERRQRRFWRDRRHDHRFERPRRLPGSRVGQARLEAKAVALPIVRAGDDELRAARVGEGVEPARRVSTSIDEHRRLRVDHRNDLRRGKALDHPVARHGADAAQRRITRAILERCDEQAVMTKRKIQRMRAGPPSHHRGDRADGDAAGDDQRCEHSPRHSRRHLGLARSRGHGARRNERRRYLSRRTCRRCRPQLRAAAQRFAQRLRLERRRDAELRCEAADEIIVGAYCSGRVTVPVERVHETPRDTLVERGQVHSTSRPGDRAGRIGGSDGVRLLAGRIGCGGAESLTLSREPVLEVSGISDEQPVGERPTIERQCCHAIAGCEGLVELAHVTAQNRVVDRQLLIAPADDR